MKKGLFCIAAGVFLLFCRSYARPPKVTGNFEQGSRYAIPSLVPSTVTKSSPHLYPGWN